MDPGDIIKLIETEHIEGRTAVQLGKKRTKVKIRILTKGFKRIRLWFRSILYLDAKIATLAGVILIVLAAIGSETVYKALMAPQIDPAVYAPLLNAIAKGESQGNYNAYFGHTANNNIQFTAMPIKQVMQWQEEYVKKGSPSSAVGKYQIVRPTLAGLVQQLKINPNEKFDEKMQDRLAVALLERRGATEYMENKISRDQFAANLAQEWAALPKVHGPNADQSYYASDGLNKVQVSTAEVFQALATIKRQ